MDVLCAYEIGLLIGVLIDTLLVCIGYTALRCCVQEAQSPHCSQGPKEVLESTGMTNEQVIFLEP